MGNENGEMALWGMGSKGLKKERTRNKESEKDGLYTRLKPVGEFLARLVRSRRQLRFVTSESHGVRVEREKEEKEGEGNTLL